MGSGQSRKSNNAQRIRVRKFADAEVREALEVQSQLDRELRSQAASAKAQAATSTPPSTSSRNFTEAEVRRALEVQKPQLEREINLLRSQVTPAKAQAATSTPSSTSSRNFTEAEVRRALEAQKSQMETEINLLRSQVTRANAQAATTTPPSTSSRNFTEAEVRRALEAQKSQMETVINLLRSQVTRANAQAATTTPPSTSSSYFTEAEIRRALEAQNSMETEINLLRSQVILAKAQAATTTPSSTSSRNSTDAEVRKPFEVQKSQLEREMNLLRSQVTPAKAQAAPSTPSSTSSRVPKQFFIRGPATARYATDPTLPTNLNQAPGTNYIPQNPVKSYVCKNSQYGPSCTPPSAPPMPSAQARQGRPISRNPVPRQKAESDDVACPTCKYRYTEKIFNCESGHASCSECMWTQQPCGKLMLTKQPCGRRITDMRNITMEEYITQKQISCPNADEGCRYTIAPDNLERHLQDCPYKEVQCMLPEDICIWKGKLSKLADHFHHFHPDCRGKISTETFLQLNNTSKTIQLIKLGILNFIVHQYTVNDKVYIAAQLIGTKTCASKWCYELHIFKMAEPRRKYVYVDKCFSMRESFDDIVKDSACAVLPMAYAKTFDNGSGDVVYKYYIKKEVGGSNDKEERKRDVSCTRGGRGGRERSRGRGRGRGDYAN